MFERFTHPARKVVVHAQDEARMLNHDYIGTEHILLGLLREEEGIAAQVLGDLGIRLEGAREEVETLIGRGKGPQLGHIPFTPRAKKVLELALRDAIQIGHTDIGTEHLLLGLVREGEGVAVEVLRELGATPDATRSRVLEKLGNPPVKTKRRGRRRATAELQAFDAPACPTCRNQLATHAATKRLKLPDDVEILVVFCRGCGRTLGTTPA
jgi:ATP-dependent Clp protease ATP-binding subunit ClpA